MDTQQDARHLSPEAQEALRRRVVWAVVDQGMTKAAAAHTFAVSRTSVHAWVSAYQARGSRALQSKRRGRPKRSRLAGWQAATAVRLIRHHCPDQLELPFVLWTREAVQWLLVKRFDIHVSVWTVGRYLKTWGFTPQKPVRQAYERNPKAVQAWLEREYPAIRRRGQQEKAEIHWGDEMGIRSDHQTGTSYGRKGKTPAIPGTGKRFGCNMISSITNRGRLSFMVFQRRFTGDVMIEFLRRLVRQSRRKVFLIVDGHPVHRSSKVANWIEKHKRRIRLFFLPGYCPDLNPDELLNQDVKSNAVGRQRPRNQSEMIRNVRSYLRSTQRQPDIVRRYFRSEKVSYAA
jgi:transposase